MQDVFNLLPNLVSTSPSALASAAGTGAASAILDSKAQSATTASPAITAHNELARAMSVKTNDQLMAIYLSSLIRAITAFHDLIENKIQNRQQQEDKESGGAGAGSNGVKKEKEKDNGVNAGDKEDAGKGAKTNGVANGAGKGAKDVEKEDGAAGKKERAKDEESERRRKG